MHENLSTSDFKPIAVLKTSFTNLHEDFIYLGHLNKFQHVGPE